MKHKGDEFSRFKIEHYSPTKSFSFAEWAIMLSRRETWHAAFRAVRSDNEETLAPEAQKEVDTHSDAAHVWSSYLDDVLPWTRPHLTPHERESWRDVKSLRALPAMTDITGELLNKNTGSRIPESQNTMPYFVEFEFSWRALFGNQFAFIGHPNQQSICGLVGRTANEISITSKKARKKVYEHRSDARSSRKLDSILRPSCP